ncbi:transglutaminase family protein [Pacificimonas sp. ICDLI1SI03]
MRITVSHITTYRYSLRPKRVMQLLRLTPESFEGQNVGKWSVDLNCDARLRSKRDAHGNIVHLLTVDDVPDELTITAGGTVDCENTSGVTAGLADPLPALVYLQTTDLTKPNAVITEFAKDVTSGTSNQLSQTHKLLAAIYERMTFETGATDVTTSAIEAFERQKGVCQDLAHLFCAACRSLGIPARYISGHLFRQDGMNDQSASHAWAEAHVNGLGWVSFDPAHGISTDEHYVRIAAGMDYRQAAPIVGTRTGGGMETLDVIARTGATPLRQSQKQTMGAMSQSQQQ